MSHRSSGRGSSGRPGGRWRLLAVLVVVALLMSGCGGDDGTASSDPGGDGDAGADPADGADEQGSGDPDEEGGQGDTGGGSDDGAGDGGEPAGASTASVTLGDETYTADLAAPLTVCISMGGALAGSGPVVGIEDANLSIDLPPEGWESGEGDWDPPSIRLDLGEDADGVPIDWRAGGDIVGDFPELEGQSQVDSFTIDGGTATGTATFLDFFQFQLAGAGQVDDPEPVQGTFELTCG